MQRKTLLYIFGVTSVAGLVLGTAFFANELRLKIIQGPDENQFGTAAEKELTAALGDALKKSAQNKNGSQAAPAVVPQTPAAPPQPENAPPVPEVADPENSDTGEEESGLPSFAIIGDTREFDPKDDEGGLQKAADAIRKKDVDIVLALGDLFSGCDGGSKCEGKLDGWKEALGDLYAKTYAVMGEKDRDGGEKSDSLWKKFFDLPKNGPEGYEELTYSFDRENSHFVVLNSEKPEKHVVDKAQREWLEEDLSKNGKENTFVFFHEPAYPVSEEIGSSLDAEKEERDALWKILKDKKVTAVFSGHERIASRKKIDGVYQYVFGNTDSKDQALPEGGKADWSHQGKSYGIVKVEGKKITVEAYSIGGELLDSFEISS